jgi:hypothetical protein
MDGYSQDDGFQSRMTRPVCGTDFLMTAAVEIIASKRRNVAESFRKIES